MPTQIDSLSVGIQTNAKTANKGVDSLIATLGKLETALTGVSGKTSGIGKIATAAKEATSGVSKLSQAVKNASGAMSNGSTKGTKWVKSLTDVAAGIGLAHIGIRGFANALKSAIGSANSYIEDVNLFTASLGKYADEAEKYAQKVSNVMGIDPAKWMRNQGVFMTLAQGFGVAGDRAYTMSQQLTQLGYDLSSFFNIAVDGEGGSMQKLQAGLAGELEPLRRLGFDLSQTRLQAIAASLGIEKLYTQMNQAEKSQLRYYAIMTQVTTAQGDMARTLNAPSNQMRIFSAQLQMAARAIGNIFIPAMNAILPIAIAVVKVVRLAAEAIASFFGYTLPEIDYSGLQEVAGGFDDIGTAAEGAGGAAKKLKSYLMGFDELNVIDPSQGSGGGGGGGSGAGAGGSDWEFPLPTYDFLGDAIESKVDSIMAKIKPAVDWISEHVKEVLLMVAGIGTAMLAWKIGSGFSSELGTIQSLFSVISAIALSLATVAITVSLVYNFDTDFLQGEGWGNLIGDALSTALGVAVTKYAIGKTLGAKAGLYAAAVTLAVSAGTTLKVLLFDTDFSEFSWEKAALGISGALKTGLSAALFAKATGLTLGKSALVGSAFGLFATAGLLFKMAYDKVITDTLDWGFFAGQIGGALLTSLGAGALAAGLGLSIAPAMGIGFIIGATITLGLDFAAMYNRKKGISTSGFDWGQVSLDAEEIGKVAEGLFEIPVSPTIKLVDATITDQHRVEEALEETFGELEKDLRLINLGFDVDGTAQDALIEKINGENGIIAQVDEVLKARGATLSVGLSLLPEDAEIDVSDLLGNWETSSEAIVGTMKTWGGELVKWLNVGQEDEMAASKQEMVNKYLGYINDIASEFTKQKAFASFEYDTGELLSKLDRESFSAALQQYATIESELRTTLESQYKETYTNMTGMIAASQKAYEQAVAEYGEGSDEAQRLKQQVDYWNEQLKLFMDEGSVDAMMAEYSQYGHEAWMKAIQDMFYLDSDSMVSAITTASGDWWDMWWWDKNYYPDDQIQHLAQNINDTLEKELKKTMSDDDWAVYLDARKKIGFHDWDMIGEDAQNALIAQLRAMKLTDDQIEAVFKQAGIDIGEDFLDGVTDTVSGRGSGSKKGRPGRAGQALAEEIKTGFAAKLGGILTEAANKTNKLPSIFRNAGVQSKTKFNDGLDAVEIKELSVKTKLVKEGWTTVAEFVTGAGMSAVQQAISLIKHGWSTVSGYTESHKGSETVDEGVTLSTAFGAGLSTVTGWLATKEGADYYHKVLLGPAWGSTTVTGWLGSAGVAGGMFTKPVGLTKDFGGKDTVTEWVNQSLGSGSVDVIAKVKRSLVHGGYTYTGAAQWLTGTTDGSVTIKVRRTGDVLNGFSVTQGEEVVNGISKSSVVVRESDKSDTDARNVDIIAAIYTLIDAVNDKEMNVSIGDKDIYDANSRYERKRGYVTNPGQFQNSY